MKICIFLFLIVFNAYSATSTTYDVMNMNMVDKKAVNFDGRKVAATVATSSVANLDITLADDELLSGVVLYSPQSCADDEVKLQVLAGSTLLSQYADWYVAGGINKELEYPAKILGGLTIRAVYKNTCTIPVSVKLNYSLHKVLQ